jgi:hypothetical protein
MERWVVDEAMRGFRWWSRVWNCEGSGTGRGVDAVEAVMAASLMASLVDVVDAG